MDVGQQAGAAPITGAQFGKYRIVRKVGEGAFGSVYEALLPGPMGFTKRVALKMIRRHLVREDPRFVQSMVNEARIGGLLHHANIVDVVEFDHVEEHYFLAMEFVDGATLAEIIQLCRHNQVLLPRFAIVDLALQVCRGLHYAHSLQVDGRPLQLVHRDLKPSNIIVDTSGTAKILDFGIAKASSNLFNTTESAMVKGTPRYMSPEQIAGNVALTPRSDIFSLGAVLFEVVTGRVLFDAPSLPSLVHAIVYEDHGPSLDQAEVAFPGSREVLRRALDRNPAARYDTVLQMAADLRGLGHAYPPEAEMSEVISRLMPRVDRTQTSEILNSGDLAINGSTAALPPAGLDPLTEQPAIAPADPTSAGWDRFSRVFTTPSQEVVRGTMLTPDIDDDLAATGSAPAVIGPTPRSGGSRPSGVVATSPTSTVVYIRKKPWGAIGIGLVMLFVIVLSGWWLVGRPGLGGTEDLVAEAPAIDPSPGPGTPAGASSGDPQEKPDPPSKQPDDMGASGASAVAESTREVRTPTPAVEVARVEPSSEQPGTKEPSPPPPQRPPDGTTIAVADPAEPGTARTQETSADKELKPGTFTVSCKPPANLVVDGRPMGTNRNFFRSVELSGGTHTVELLCPQADNRTKVWEVEIDGAPVSLGCWNFTTMTGDCS